MPLSPDNASDSKEKDLQAVARGNHESIELDWLINYHSHITLDYFKDNSQIPFLKIVHEIFFGNKINRSRCIFILRTDFTIKKNLWMVISLYIF